MAVATQQAPALPSVQVTRRARKPRREWVMVDGQSRWVQRVAVSALVRNLDIRARRVPNLAAWKWAGALLGILLCTGALWLLWVGVGLTPVFSLIMSAPPGVLGGGFAGYLTLGPTVARRLGPLLFQCPFYGQAVWVVYRKAIQEEVLDKETGELQGIQKVTITPLIHSGGDLLAWLKPKQRIVIEVGKNGHSNGKGSAVTQEEPEVPVYSASALFAGLKMLDEKEEFRNRGFPWRQAQIASMAMLALGTAVVALFLIMGTSSPA